MIKDNGFENTSGNGELEDELLEALNKKGLLPTDEEAAADGETAGQGEAAEEAGPGEDAEDSAQPEEESLEEFLSLIHIWSADRQNLRYWIRFFDSQGVYYRHTNKRRMSK